MLATIMLIFTAILTTWCMLLLLWAKDKLVADGHRVLSFSDVGEYACGPWGRRAVDIAIFGAQLGFCCAYFGFVAENMHSVIFSYFDCTNVAPTTIMLIMSMFFFLIFPFPLRAATSQAAFKPINPFASVTFHFPTSGLLTLFCAHFSPQTRNSFLLPLDCAN